MRASFILVTSVRRFLFTASLLVLLVPAQAQDSPLFTEDFPPEEFAARRDRIFDAIGPDAIAIVQGEPTPRGYVRFRQSNEFYYLTGVEVPHAYLIMDGSSRRSQLFLPRRDARREASEGRMLTSDDPDLVGELTGLPVAAPEQLTSSLLSLMRRSTVRTVYTPFQPAEGLSESRDLGIRRIADRLGDAWDGRPSREANFIALLQARLPALQVRDLSPVLDDLRTIKSERELALIRRATRLSGLALMEAMRSVEPGVVEREIDALSRFIYLRNGAQGDAYYSLVASGPNAWYPHYHAGSRTMQSGELLLMDFAPDVGYYMSDLTRMMPVSGRFTPEQRELYGFYEVAYRAILAHIRPGVTPKQIKAEATLDMRRALESWRFSKDIHAAAARSFVDAYARGAESEYTSLGHGVGMATHDVGSYSGPLKAGMVFTIEPALRVPEEQLYIRMEDLIIIHEDRAEIVSDFVPMSIEDIEALMAEQGLLQAYPPDDSSSRSNR